MKLAGMSGLTEMLMHVCNTEQYHKASCIRKLYCLSVTPNC